MSRAIGAATSIAPWVWGAAVAFALARPWFGYGPGEIHLNHETWSYVYRVIAFGDALAHGHWSPQWVTYFRGGLGSPYFGYYQPGFFYVAALLATRLPVMTAIAAAVWTFAFVGYAGVFSLVRGRFGVASGVLAGTMLLVATYVRSELYRRGDLSEFAGMMTIAATLAVLVGWLEDGGRWRWAALALGAGAVVVLHPVAGLAGYATFGTAIAVWTLATRAWSRALAAAAALAVGIGLATFYWLPLWLEWSFVQGENATKGYRVVDAFLSPLVLLGLAPEHPFLPRALGLPTLSLVAVACGITAWRWRAIAPPQRRLFAVLAVLAVGSTVMMASVSSIVWESVPLLALVQFPWRLLMVHTVALAAITGCIVSVPRAVPLVVAALVAWPLVGLRPVPMIRFTPCTKVQQLQAQNFAPDSADEWLPTGAQRLVPHGAWHIPTITGPGTVAELDRTTDSVHAKIATDAPAVVTLPHYYFPAGWYATLDGEPVPIGRDARGLITVSVPRGGFLEVRFTMTPARRTGLVVSAATLALLVLGVALGGRRRLAVAASLVVVSLGASGCGGVGYVLRGGIAEARILLRREPILELLARPDLGPDMRERLGLVLDVRRFAERDLGLRVGDSYSTFAEVDGEAPVWVLSAAHRDRLEPYTWWYPIVGRVPYQGYFDRDEADRAARALAAQGLDVDIRPASAFSTLGWFADPVLSTTLKAAPVILVETVIHELFHATLYVPSAVPFNESAAMFVGFRGAAAFFCDGPGRDAARCAEVRHRWSVVRAHGRVLERYVRRLRAVYADSVSLPARERARDELARRAGTVLARRGLGSADELAPPNNARLLAMLAYETDLGTFDRLAPSDAAVPEAIARIVGAVRGAPDPFAAVRALDTNPLQTERTRLDSTLPWRPSISRWTPCSGGSLAGCGSSGTTWRTARTSAVAGSSRARGASGG
jgi:predicted aminopeptidase